MSKPKNGIAPANERAGQVAKLVQLGVPAADAAKLIKARSRELNANAIRDWISSR